MEESSLKGWISDSLLPWDSFRFLWWNSLRPSCGRAEMGVWADNRIMEDVWLFFALCYCSQHGDRWWQRCPRLWLCRAALSHCCQGTTRCLSLPVLALALCSARTWPPPRLLDPSFCLCLSADNFPPTTSVLVENTHPVKCLTEQFTAAMRLHKHRMGSFSSPPQHDRIVKRSWSSLGKAKYPVWAKNYCREWWDSCCCLSCIRIGRNPLSHNRDVHFAVSF